MEAGERPASLDGRCSIMGLCANHGWRRARPRLRLGLPRASAMPAQTRLHQQPCRTGGRDKSTVLLVFVNSAGRGGGLRLGSGFGQPILELEKAGVPEWLKDKNCCVGNNGGRAAPTQAF